MTYRRDVTKLHRLVMSVKGTGSPCRMGETRVHELMSVRGASRMKLAIWLITAVSLAFGTETPQAHAEILNTDNVLSIRPSPGTAGKPLKVVMIIKGPWQNANLFYNIFYDAGVALSATTRIPIGKVANGASRTVSDPTQFPYPLGGSPSLLMCRS